MNLKHIYDKIGKEQGISGQEVKAQIQNAIDLSYASAKGSENEFWSKVSKNGKAPSADDVILYIVNEMKNKKH